MDQVKYCTLFRGLSLFFQGEFTDNGCETHFTVAEHSGYIKAVSSGHKVTGLNYSLVFEDIELKPVKELL